MPCIYIIKNTINDKVYIGQTIQDLKQRFRQHQLCGEKGYKLQSKFYKAMYELGVNNFYYEQLQYCNVGDLDRLEINYISKYDSFNNGYNSTQGGKQHKGMYTEPDWLSDMLQDYEAGESYKNLAIKYNCSINYINKLLKSGSIEKRDGEYYSENYSYKDTIIMYTKEFEPVTKFDTIREAVEWLKKNTEFKISDFNGYTYITAACEKCNIAYNHRWQKLNDLYYDNELFRSKIDIEAYKNGAEMQPNELSMLCNDEIIVKFTHQHKCKICGKRIDKSAELCLDCYKKQNSEHIPNQDTLMALISQYSYEEIGRQYNVSGKAVRKWCDKYNLVESQQRDSSGVTCMELNIHFETFKKAAEYLVNNGLVDSNNYSRIGYNISQAKKSSKTYKGFHWA